MASCKVPARRTATPAVSNRLILVASAAGSTTTKVGVSDAVRTNVSWGPRSAARSNTIRLGGTRGCTCPRTVSEGSSNRAVRPPTAMASKYRLQGEN